MNMLLKTLITVTISFLLTISLRSQVTPNDGDWSEKYLTLRNTPEAEVMVRTGDIDNLNFGWPTSFDPFSGNDTPRHAYPWTPDPADPDGTDRILVITSYTGNPPAGQDGYTTHTSRPDNSVRPIILTFDTVEVTIQSAILQMFVDDFQAPLWQASYEVYFDNLRIPFMESIINQLLQTGPIGKIISVEIPSNYLYLLEDGILSILIDDYTTGAGDGYAIDFAKLLLNPSAISQTGTISGTIRDNSTLQPLEDVKVVANGLVEAFTDASGNYTLTEVLAGLVSAKTFKPGYGSQIKTISLVAGQTVIIDFDLVQPAPQILNVIPANASMDVPLGSKIEVAFDRKMNLNTINSSSFILTDIDSTLSGTFAKTDSTVTFTPSLPLKPEKDYWVTLTTTIKSIDNVNLEQDYSWTFSTKTSTDIEEGAENQLNSHLLLQNYPNPFNPSTTIEFNLPSANQVTLQIFNIFGQEVATLVLDRLSAGSYSYKWSPLAGMSSGVYLYRLKAGDFVKIKKMILMR